MIRRLPRHLAAYQQPCSHLSDIHLAGAVGRMYGETINLTQGNQKCVSIDEHLSPDGKRCAHFQSLGVEIETLRGLHEVNFNPLLRTGAAPSGGARTMCAASLSFHKGHARLIVQPPRRKMSGTGWYIPSHSEWREEARATDVNHSS